MVSTNYTKVTPSSTNFLKSPVSTDALLLEGGDKLLLENGTDAILLEFVDSFSNTYTKASIPSTDWS